MSLLLKKILLEYVKEKVGKNTWEADNGKILKNGKQMDKQGKLEEGRNPFFQPLDKIKHLVVKGKTPDEAIEAVKKTWKGEWDDDMIDHMKKWYKQQTGKKLILEGYWLGNVGSKDDFGQPIDNIFIDGKTIHGPWAIMSETSWAKHGVGKLGTGYGQKYERQSNGKWKKIEG